jgi:hypothetical protein
MVPHAFTASLVIGVDEVATADMPGTHVTVGIGPLVLQPSVGESLPDVLRALADQVERVVGR